MLTSGCFVDNLSLFEQSFIQPLMSLLRRNELDPAMSADEAGHPLSRFTYIGKAICWPLRAVFQRTEGGSRSLRCPGGPTIFPVEPVTQPFKQAPCLYDVTLFQEHVSGVYLHEQPAAHQPTDGVLADWQ